MSRDETETAYAAAPPAGTDRVSGYPLPGWRTRLIESNEALIDNRIHWRVRLEHEKKLEPGTPRARYHFAEGRSAIGLLEAWDEAIARAKEIDRQHG